MGPGCQNSTGEDVVDISCSIHYAFTAESDGKRIWKIGHLRKLW